MSSAFGTDIPSLWKETSGTGHPDDTHQAVRPVPLAPRQTGSRRLTPQRMRPSVSNPTLSYAHPLIILEPPAGSFRFLANLRRRGIPLYVLASRRMVAGLYLRGAHGMHLSSFLNHPEEARARLLELAGRLEPRPLILPFSNTAVQWLRSNQQSMAPHYECPLFYSADMPMDISDNAEKELRQTILAGKPAFEVQLTIDIKGRVTNSFILAWTAGASPVVVASSISGSELLQQSRNWLIESQVLGFARLIFAPNHFGTVVLKAMTPYPQDSWELATSNRPDLACSWYAASLQMPLAPTASDSGATHRLSVLEPENRDACLPLVAPTPTWSLTDPASSLVGFLASMVGN